MREYDRAGERRHTGSAEVFETRQAADAPLWSVDWLPGNRLTFVWLPDRGTTEPLDRPNEEKMGALIPSEGGDVPVNIPSALPARRIPKARNVPRG